MDNLQPESTLYINELTLYTYDIIFSLLNEHVTLATPSNHAVHCNKSCSFVIRFTLIQYNIIYVLFPVIRYLLHN